MTVENGNLVKYNVDLMALDGLKEYGKIGVKKVIHKEVYVVRLSNGCKLHLIYHNGKCIIKKVYCKDIEKKEETEKLLGIYKKTIDK